MESARPFQDTARHCKTFLIEKNLEFGANDLMGHSLVDILFTFVTFSHLNIHLGSVAWYCLLSKFLHVDKLAIKISCFSDDEGIAKCAKLPVVAVD